MRFRLCLATILSLFAIFSLTACAPEDDVPTTTATDSLDDLNGSRVIGQGALSGANGYLSAGDVQLVRSADGETYSLVFENFGSSNGPDLKVYLASDNSSADFINLGDLKSTNGTLRYDFPANQYESRFDTAVIWCQQFSQLFGYAPLAAP